MIKVIFFDLGGVIILNKVRKIYGKWAIKLGVSVDELSAMLRNFNDLRMKGTSVSAEEFLVSGKIGFITPSQLIKLRNDLWGTEYVNQYLLDFIAENKNKYTYGVISNNFKEAEEVLLKKFKVPKFYKLFISSYDIGVLKPDPKVYKKAIKECGFEPEECLFIDDSIGNVRGAEKVGMVGLQFLNNDQFERDISEKT